MKHILSKLIHKEDIMILWFIGEIVQIILFTIGSIYLLWLYSPFTILWKIVLTIFGTIVTYDMLKHFVHVRWILYKNGVLK